MNDILKKRIDTRYFGVFLFTLCFILVAQIFVQFSILRQEHNSTMINIAGRQRMLSQRLAKTALLLDRSENKNATKKEVLQTLNFLIEAHDKFKAGSYVSGKTSELSDDLLSRYRELDPIIAKIKVSTQCLVDECSTYKYEMQMLLKETENFLFKMNNIVNYSEKQSRNQLLSHSLVEFSLFFVTAFIMIFGFFKVFQPIKKILLAQISELTKRKKFIASVEQIASIGSWELDPQTGHVQWSDEVYRIHKLPLGTPTNKIRGISFYAPHERARITKCVEDCIAKKKKYDEEFEFIDNEGNHKWVRAIGEPVLTPKGEVDKLIGVFQDVTNKKRREQKIKESQKYFELAVKGANLGIWDWQLKDNSVKFDQRWAEMLGLNFDEIDMTLSTWEDRVHPEDLEQCYKDINDYLEGKTTYYENIHRMKHANGQWVYILDRGQFSDWDDKGKPTRFTGTHLDITEIKKLQEEQRFILSSMNIGIWKWDIVNDHLEWDDSMYQLYEIQQESFGGAYEAWEGTLHPEDKEKANIEIQEALNGDKDFETSFRIITANNEIKSISARATIYRDESGSPISMYGLNWDSTREYKSQQELIEQRKIAQHHSKLASLGELAAGVGHEINNPLAIIKGYLQLLEESTLSLPHDTSQRHSPKKIVEKIDLAADRIANIVKGLRTFARSDDGAIQEFDIYSALEESVGMVQEIYKKDGIELIYKPTDSTLKTVKGNRGKFQQVIMNLISNARDATKDLISRRIIIETESVFDCLKIRVRDNGRGISEEDKSKVFNPFYTTKDVGEGTGIGLSLSHSIINEFGGSIEFEDNPDGGTTFLVEIPLIQATVFDSEQANEESPESNVPILNQVRVMLVDDEQSIRELLGMILENMGLTVDTFENGQEAYEHFLNRSEDYDMIISDMKMPRLDGPSFLRKIRAHSDLHQPKFFFITGGINIDFESQNNNFKDLIDGYFFKPFDITLIHQTLQETFGEAEDQAA